MNKALVTAVRLVRSSVFSVVFVTTIPLFALLTLLCFPFPFKVRYAVASRWALLNLWWLKRSCGLGYRVSGAEHIPRETAIIFSKHQSTWETLALQAIFPPQVWVMKRELLRIPFFGWALAMLGSIAIDRKAGRKAIDQLITQGRQRLDDGRWVVVFPEGTRIAPGQRGRYRIGGAVLAEHSGHPIVPVAHNAGEFWPRKGFIKRPGEIQVVIGPPIQSQGRAAAEILKEAETWIEDTMARISNPPR
ncbi:MAG: 1-acyl-sn-glycerol-3-phosphate acyltransferase [Gammaproteobacteria bacterium]|nr:1-acyl-sn-glycerol-3-phosphate acyltransferase [Gammaproteobacteria bacterium]